MTHVNIIYMKILWVVSAWAWYKLGVACTERPHRREKRMDEDCKPLNSPENE